MAINKEDLIKEAISLRKDGIFNTAYNKLSEALQLDKQDRDIKATFLLFATYGSIFKLSISSSIFINQVIEDERIIPVDWSPPVATEDEAIFVFKNNIFILSNNKTKFISFELKNEGDVLKSPVIFDKKAIFLSKYGEILSLEDEKIERIKEPFEGMVCGSPCLFKNKLYFEGVLENERYILSYNLLKKELISCAIPHEICEIDHLHLNVSPIVFKDGVIVSSDLRQRYYYIKEGGDKMAILPIDITLKEIHQCSTLFSSVLSNVILGKSPNGFFYFDIISLKGRSEVFRKKQN